MAQYNCQIRAKQQNKNKSDSIKSYGMNKIQSGSQNGSKEMKRRRK